MNFGHALKFFRRGEFESIRCRNSIILKFSLRCFNLFSIASVATCSKYMLPVMKRIALASLMFSHVAWELFRIFWYFIQSFESSLSILFVCIRYVYFIRVIICLSCIVG